MDYNKTAMRKLTVPNSGEATKVEEVPGILEQRQREILQKIRQDWAPTLSWRMLPGPMTAKMIGKQFPTWKQFFHIWISVLLTSSHCWPCQHSSVVRRQNCQPSTILTHIQAAQGSTADHKTRSGWPMIELPLLHSLLNLIWKNQEDILWDQKYSGQRD